MSEEEPQQQSIQARIAALNLGQVGRAPVTATQRPTTAPKPSLDFRRNTANLPIQNGTSFQTNGTGNEPDGPTRSTILLPPTLTISGQGSSPVPEAAAPPKLPPRKPSFQRPQPSPALPPRRPSEQLARRDSAESTSSIISTISAVSTVSALSNGTTRTPKSRTPSMETPRLRAPAYDPASLPPLPPKRSQQEKEKASARIPLKGAKSTSAIMTKEALPSIRTPALPQRQVVEVSVSPRTPSLPQRPATETSSQPTRKLPPRNIPPTTPRLPLRHERNEINGAANGIGHSAAPPPIPLSTRPDLSKLLATKPKMSSPSTSRPSQSVSSSSSCLKCRDFSEPDRHAALFPRETVPSLDWLATELTQKFPSLTDKARVIFTWLHLNVSYDVQAFFNGHIQPSTPLSTLSTGLAVCEGYAALFSAIANKAGLESIVIGGHGKGFGYQQPTPGATLPVQALGHAWNAVKIDDGEWKLIDCCWGAGNISGKGKPYNKSFTPSMFTSDNNEFGLRHFPSNKDHFFRTDGRAQISWEEYILGDRGGETVQVFGKVASQEGLSETKILPKHRKIPTSPSAHCGPTVRFQFERVCPHWDPIRNGLGKPYQYILAVHGVDGREDDFVAFDDNGTFWWADVPLEKLGVAGQTITAFVVETVQGQSGRGLSKEGYLMAKGRKAMGFQGVAAWALV